MDAIKVLILQTVFTTKKRLGRHAMHRRRHVYTYAILWVGKKFV